MLLRQYFMSVKVLDRWAHLGPDMSSHWGKVVSNVTKSHLSLPPKNKSTTLSAASPTSTTSKSHGQKSSWDHWTPAKMRARRSSVGPLSERETDVDQDSPPPRSLIYNAPTASKNTPVLPGISEFEEDEERELRVMRKAFRRWCRKAGVQAQVSGELEERDIDCNWTKAIAPQVEGRIKII